MPSEPATHIFLPAGHRALLVLATVTALGGCASDMAMRETPRPVDIRARIAGAIPASVADRNGWAADIHTALTTLDVPPDPSNVCAVLAVIEQESTYRADPEVPGLGRIAREEIDRRAGKLGIPSVAVGLALKIGSPDGRSYVERIEKARTERELSLVFEDLIDMVPLGKRLFANWNPVRTGGPMQVSIAYAEKHATRRNYPYPVATSIRHEVFTRRGGVYFGVAHLLGYPASYDRTLYRFADFNAGHYASRNAAFQNAVSALAGVQLELDGDLIRHGSDDDKPGSTELAVRSLARQLDLDSGSIRAALEQGNTLAFERTPLYRRVFELAERSEGRPLPRALVPKIALQSPKITRKLTTEWFAKRVEERQQKCLTRLQSWSP